MYIILYDYMYTYPKESQNACMYIYVYIYIYIHRERDREIYIYIYISRYISRYVYIYIYTYIHTYIHVHIHITVYSPRDGGLAAAGPRGLDLALFDYQNFPTHPHYHGPGMTYFLGRCIRIGFMEPSKYVIQGAL